VSVRVLVLTGFGINCDAETEFAFRRAGARSERAHLNDLIAEPSALLDYHILAVPGGFSFGDDIASGKVLANRLRYKLGEALQEFIANGKLAIGICNGFQVLVKMGMLPYTNSRFEQTVTLTHNESGRFEDRWVHLIKPSDTRCVWLEGVDALDLPVRHGEGKFMTCDAATLDGLRQNGQIALRYATPNRLAASGTFPANPNGSIDDVAAICDPSGRLFGLMPHPEAYVTRTQHPRWTREQLPEDGAGLRIFQNAVQFAESRMRSELASPAK
jgi:phosphoribosylformylglycinamidine synthase I